MSRPVWLSPLGTTGGQASGRLSFEGARSRSSGCRDCRAGELHATRDNACFKPGYNNFRHEEFTEALTDSVRLCLACAPHDPPSHLTTPSAALTSSHLTAPRRDRPSR